MVGSGDSSRIVAAFLREAAAEMYSKEKRVLLREYLRDGWSKSAVARKLGISRRTVHNWIASGQLDRDLDVESVSYGPRPPVEHKIDEYRGIINSRLESYPELSAVRIFEEIKAAGYTGSYTQVKEYVRGIRPVQAPEPVQRFETPAGRQAQVDFAHFKFPWGVRWALVVVLAYSRLLWVKFYPRQTMAVLMRGLEEAFAFFGGVPAECLFDQMKSVVIEDHRGEGGALVENIEFVRFANHWGFRVRSCRPYRAKTKGKVERPIRYLRENFRYGREFVGDEDLDDQLSWWLDNVANIRVHGTTEEQPLERFLRDEKALLQPLAPRPYQRVGTSGTPTSKTPARVTPFVDVERRPLEVYQQFAGGEA